MGQKHSFYSYQIKFSTGLADTVQNITGSTSAPNQPPTLTSRGSHGLVDGDVILLSGAKHPTVNGFYQIKKTNDTTFQLATESFADLGLSGQIFGDTATFKKVIMSPFCDATSKEEQRGSKNYETVTTNCDDYPQEEGEVQAGSLKFGFYYDIDDEVQRYLEKKFYDDETIFVQYKPKRAKTLRGYRAGVAAFSDNGEVGAKFKGDIEFKLRSKPQDIKLTA